MGNERRGQPGGERELAGNFSSTDYSKLDYNRAWSSQEWKSEGTTHDRSGQPDEASWRMLQHVPGHEEGTENHFVIDQGNLLLTTIKKWEIPKNSS